MTAMEKIAGLAKLAAGFVLPPKRMSSRTRTFKVGSREDTTKTLDDPSDNGSQSPHRYGRKPDPNS